MKYASVCSGVEAPSQAWEPFGWEPQWFSEIEDFPSMVLAHHFPNVPNLGDMTKLTTNEVFNATDIQLLIGGTPCQSFSVAGLRKGLEDPRGNLALEFVRILSIKKPKWFIWENVPGVLSSGGGRDFSSIIGAFTKIGYGVSWRVLDAQFFGVPQRRRRVFVVGYFGNWRPSWRVLFESEGLPGDFKKSREEREGLAGDIENNPYFSKQRIDQYKRSGLSSTLAARDSRGPDDLIAQVIRYSKSHRPTHTEQRVSEDGTTNTLSTGEGCGNQSSQNFVCCPCITYGIRAANTSSNGKGVQEERSHALDRASPHFVFTINGSNDCLVSNKAYSLNTNSNATGRNVSKLFNPLGIRRLTPLECERLQGFKDNWTNIPGATNSKRYKACGNSMAVPVIKWLGKRILEVEGRG